MSGGGVEIEEEIFFEFLSLPSIASLGESLFLPFEVVASFGGGGEDASDFDGELSSPDALEASALASDGWSGGGRAINGCERVVYLSMYM